MELLRHDNDAWGQSMLTGVSWDLLWIPFVAAFAVIIVHQIFRLRRGATRHADTTSGDLSNKQPTQAAIDN